MVKKNLSVFLKEIIGVHIAYHTEQINNSVGKMQTYNLEAGVAHCVLTAGCQSATSDINKAVISIISACT